MKHLLLLVVLALPVATAEPPLRDLLRDALFTEEVDRDPAKAAGQYQQLLERFDEQRPLAASALFRLAEIRRQQGREEEAVAFYQRLLREFPDADRQAELARRQLAELGGELPQPGPEQDAEQAELARLREMTKTAPDVLTHPDTLRNAVENEWPEVVAFLLENGARPDGACFEFAAVRGRLDICRLLFDVKPLPDDAFDLAFEAAVDRRGLEVLRQLLELGLDPKADYKWSPPIHDVVRKRWPEGLDLLAKASVDLDRSTPGPDGITPLHDAAQRGSLEMVTQLLKLGAQPDPATDPSGTRPLHFALLADEGDRLAIVKCLLEAGADPNLPTRAQHLSALVLNGKNLVASRRDLDPPTSPLQLALRFHPAAVPLLLDTGAPPPPGFLVEVIKADQLDLCGSLLDAGARPEASEWSALVDAAARKDPDGSLVTRLLEFRPDDLTLDKLPAMWAWTAPSRDAYLRTVIAPAVAPKPAIHFFSSHGGRLSVFEERTGSDSSAPEFAWLLFEHRKDLQIGSSDRQIDWRSLELLRRNPDGEVVTQAIRFDDSEPFPTLQWGDLLVAHKPQGAYNRSYDFHFLWAVERRISFPITVTIDGTDREITLRGDCLVHDPTTDVRPLVQLDHLAPTLWAPGYDFDPQADTAPRIIVTRAGWGEIPIAWKARDFDLRPGDRLRLELPEDIEERRAVNRAWSITLRVPHTGFEASHSCSIINGELVESTVPTLVAFLADVLSPAFPRSHGAAFPPSEDEPSKGLGAFLYSRDGIIPPALRAADFGAIRILRLAGEGPDEEIRIDLAAAIQACTDETTPEEARAGDLRLRPGDIVELPLLADAPDGRPGLSPGQARYFSKVLSGRLQNFVTSDAPELLLLEWQPREWIPTPVGPLPFDPARGYPTTRASDRYMGQALKSSFLSVDRGAGPMPGVSKGRLFLEADDRVYRGVQAARSPRPRVVPPPAPHPRVGTPPSR